MGPACLSRLHRHWRQSVLRPESVWGSTQKQRRLIPTVFSFGAVLDEYLERDLGIVLAALLQGRPRRLGVKVRLERDQADAQGREVAVEVVVFSERKRADRH